MDNDNTKLILQEVGVSASKGLIGAIPYVGTAFNEIIFELRGRLKQARVNKFIEQLIKYMENINENDIKMDYIRSENFGDIFESIIKRIIYNKSEEKLQRFKRILVKQMISPYETDYTETFLDIVARINDCQIFILDIHKKIKFKQLEDGDNIIDVGTIDANFENKISKYRTPDFYQLDIETYNFYVQDLISKTLLADMGMNRIGVQPFELLEITKFGIEFLKFIEFQNNI